MLRHRAYRPDGIAPQFVSSVDEMPGDERKEHWISAAHLQDFFPVGGVPPADNFLPGLEPAQDARAVLGGNKDAVLLIRQLDDGLTLKFGVLFHERKIHSESKEPQAVRRWPNRGNVARP